MTPDDAIRKALKSSGRKRDAVWALHKAQGKPAPRLTPKGLKHIEEDLRRIPQAMRAGLEKSAEGITWAQAQRRARKLAAEGHITNPKRFGAWLYWVGKT